MEDKKVDPGWNDPPMLNYDSANPPPRTRITNKRVAFPLNSQTTKSQPMSSLPPIPPNTAVVPPSNLEVLEPKELKEKDQENG